MTIPQFNNRNPFSANNKQVHNIKTAGGPKRSTRRKIARPTATYTPRCSGAGERPMGRTAMENMWTKADIGWWNYDLFTYAGRWSGHDTRNAASKWTRGEEIMDMKYSAKNPSPWTSGTEYVPQGVQTLGDRTHIAKTSARDDARRDLCAREDVFWDSSSTPTKAYRAQMDAQQHADAVAKLRAECSHSQAPTDEQRMWDNIRAGVSNGKATRKGGN